MRLKSYQKQINSDPNRIRIPLVIINILTTMRSAPIGQKLQSSDLKTYRNRRSRPKQARSRKAEKEKRDEETTRVNPDQLFDNAVSSRFRSIIRESVNSDALVDETMPDAADATEDSSEHSIGETTQNFVNAIANPD